MLEPKAIDCSIYLDEIIGMVFFYEYFHGSLEMCMGKEHAEAFDFGLLDFCIGLFLLFPEKAYFSDRICLFQPITNIIDGNEYLWRLNTWLFSNSLQDLIIFKLILKDFHYFFILVLIDIISKLFDKFIKFSIFHPFDDIHGLLKVLSAYDFFCTILRLIRL